MPWVHRVESHSISGREDSFREGVRARDRKCVITGVVNRRAPTGYWGSFEAAHIFPVGAENIWREGGFSKYITDMDNATGVTKINSCQNGFLLRSHVHTDFDQYLISVNPDVSSLHYLNCVFAYELLQDGYKVVVFCEDLDGLDGRILDSVCRNPGDPHRISDAILRWHFRQCILGNMRGAGEPTFENDFPPGTDMMKVVREGPYSKERFELELAARLGVTV